MNIIFLLSLFLLKSNAGWVNIDVSQSYACLGTDGVPIGTSSTLADTCCSNGQLVANPPSSCIAGFNSITADAATGAAGGISLAQQTLATAGSIDGNNLSTSAPALTSSGGAITPTSESSASTAGGSGSGANGNASNSAGNNSASNPNASKSSSAGSNGSGAGGSGMSLGTAGGTSAASTVGSGTDPNDQQANLGGYSKSGDGKAGSKGDGMSNPFGGLFGGDGKGDGKGGAGGPNELSFGDGSGKDGNGANGAGDDGDGKGTAEDPSDYFNRIDKSANIFKIVSSRYMKKKSLWVTPIAPSKL